MAYSSPRDPVLSARCKGNFGFWLCTQFPPQISLFPCNQASKYLKLKLYIDTEFLRFKININLNIFFYVNMFRLLKLLNFFFKIVIARKNLNERELMIILRGEVERITMQLGKIKIRIIFYISNIKILFFIY